MIIHLIKVSECHSKIKRKFQNNLLSFLSYLIACLQLPSTTRMLLIHSIFYILTSFCTLATALYFPHYNITGGLIWRHCWHVLPSVSSSMVRASAIYAGDQGSSPCRASHLQRNITDCLGLVSVSGPILSGFKL